MRKADYGLTDNQLEKTRGRLLLYRVTAAELLYVQRWKNTERSTLEDQTMKMTELAEMTKLTYLIRDKTRSTFLKKTEHPS